MTLYTRALHFKNGETLTITDKEMQSIQMAILAGHKWLKVQKQLISIDTVARIGNHHATAEMQKRQEADTIRELELAGRSALVDEHRRLIYVEASTRSPSLPKSTAVVSTPIADKPDCLYWEDEHGIRYYT
jgi:hypothetical protein